MAVDSDTLELIRKTLYGGAQGGVLDFNSVFAGVPTVGASSSGSQTALLDLLGSASGGGNGPTGPSVGNPNGGLAANAIGSIAAQAILGIVVPAISGIPGSGSIAGRLIGLPSISQAIGNLGAIGSDSSTPDAGPGEGTVSVGGLSVDADATAAANAGGDSGSSGTSSGDGSGGVGVGDGGTGYATGGFVPGHDITGSDNIPAKLSGGEFVVPTKIVDMLGTNFFEKLLLTKSPMQEAMEKEAAKQSAKAGA